MKFVIRSKLIIDVSSISFAKHISHVVLIDVQILDLLGTEAVTAGAHEDEHDAGYTSSTRDVDDRLGLTSSHVSVHGVGLVLHSGLPVHSAISRVP